jgi:hypothetical protein
MGYSCIQSLSGTAKAALLLFSRYVVFHIDTLTASRHLHISCYDSFQSLLLDLSHSITSKLILYGHFSQPLANWFSFSFHLPSR